MQDPNSIIKRYTFSLDETAQGVIYDLAKAHKITQGEVIETLVAFMGHSEEAITDAFNARRESKVNNRTSPWAIYQREKEARKQQNAESE